jgi:hypothetical protein
MTHERGSMPPSTSMMRPGHGKADPPCPATVMARSGLSQSLSARPPVSRRGIAFQTGHGNPSKRRSFASPPVQDARVPGVRRGLIQ